MKIRASSLAHRTTVFLVLSICGPSSLWAFVNGQNATLVIGKDNFNGGGTGIVTAAGVTYDGLSQQLFASDMMTNHVYIYQGALTNGQSASHVLGIAAGAVGSPDVIKMPSHLAYDHVNKRLFVADRLTWRVLVFDLSLGITDYMPAANVIGQQSMGPWVIPVCDAANLRRCINVPSGLALDVTDPLQPSPHNRLFVSDNWNNRVLVFDLTGGLSSGMDASFVLGQPDFNSNGAAATASGMNHPNALTYDPGSQRLFVADTGNRRVLVFDLANGLSNGQNAVHVLGQTDLTQNNLAVSANQNMMSRPTGLAFDPVQQRLFITDGFNDAGNDWSNRVLVFNLWGGIADGMNAAAVLGQADFKGSLANEGAGWLASASGLSGPNSVAYDPDTGELFVADTMNGRVVGYNANELATTTPLCGNPYTICGTVSAAEDSSPLASVPVQLLSADGELLRTTKTDQNGAYRFESGGLTPKTTYFITPAVGRTMSAIPLQTPVTALTSVGAVADMQIRGWTSPLQVAAGIPGAAVLISTANFTGVSAPMLSPSSPESAGFTSTASGSDGMATVQLPKGTYFITCWVPQISDGSVRYTRVPASGSSGPYATATSQGLSAACTHVNGF